MEKASALALFDKIGEALGSVHDTESREHLLAGLSLLVDDYSDKLTTIDELRLELASVTFDRDCLQSEKRELENELGIINGDDGLILERLVDEGIPRDKKIAAIKFVRKLTGWGLKQCKEWVESHYYAE